MSKWRLVDYPHCAVCVNSEQYSDGTFICIYDGCEQPLKYSECGELKVNDEYIVGYLTLLTKLLKKKGIIR